MKSPFLGEPLKLVAVLRKMAGSTQSSLVQCDDGRLYVAKLYPSPNTANALANEAIGAQLQHHLDIPVPPWRTLFVSSDDIAKYPKLRFEIVGGHREPEPGMHFATQYLADLDHTITDVISWPAGVPVLNYLKFFDMYLFDVWADHCDRRQWVYKVNRETHFGKAVFIDNSHLFGNASWGKPAQGQFQRSNTSIMPLTHAYDFQLRGRVQELRRRIPEVLHRVIAEIPPEWHVSDINHLELWLLRRLDALEDLVKMNLAFHGFGP